MESSTFLKLSHDLLRCSTLSIYERLCIAYIQSYQQNSLQCFASNRTIAKELGLTFSSVKKAHTNLVKKGILEITLSKNAYNVDVHYLYIHDSVLADHINGSLQATPAVATPTPPEPIQQERIHEGAVQPLLSVEDSGSPFDNTPSFVDNMCRLYPKLDVATISKIHSDLIRFDEPFNKTSFETFIPRKYKHAI